MAERQITEEAIDWVLANYHSQWPAEPRRGSKPALIRVGTHGGREIRVYIERDADPIFVKTVA